MKYLSIIKLYKYWADEDWGIIFSEKLFECVQFYKLHNEIFNSEFVYYDDNYIYISKYNHINFEELEFIINNYLEKYKC